MCRRWIKGNDKEETRIIKGLFVTQAASRMYPGSFRLMLRGEADYIGHSSPGGLQEDRAYRVTIDYNPDRKWLTVEAYELKGHDREYEKRIYMDASKLLNDWYIYELTWQIYDIQDGIPLTDKYEFLF